MSTRRTTPARLAARRPAQGPRALCALLLALASPSGCGGDTRTLPDPTGESAGTEPPPPPPSPPIELSASLSSVKRLTLSWSWPGLALAQRALILEDPDGEGPLPAEQLADVAAADGTATVEIFLPIALQASYQVALCGATQCAHSAPLRLPGSLEQAMGRLKAVTPQRNDEFGVALALSQDGRVLAVGANAGSVHLFERTGLGQWAARAPVDLPLPAPGPDFGRALSLSADGAVLAIGSRGSNGAGAAYVYRRQGEQWVFNARLLGSEVDADDDFSASLALSGDGLTLVAGAPGDDGPGDTLPDDGAVYVFSDGGGTWTQTRLLRDGGSADGDRFGESVALSANGAVLAVGSPINDAPGFGVHPAPVDTQGAQNAGAVHVYRRAALQWAYEAFIQSPIDLNGGQFGTAVALDALGDTLAVSAPDADLDPQGVVDPAHHGGSGSVHVLVRSGGQWRPHGLPLRSPTPRASEAFGKALSLSADGQTVVVGTWEHDRSGLGVAPGESATVANDAGSGFVLSRHAEGWGAATVLQPSDSPSGNRGIRLGYAVAISGDGRTVAVGARSHGGPGSGVSSDPTIAYDPDTAFALSGAVFLY